MATRGLRRLGLALLLGLTSCLSEAASRTRQVNKPDRDAGSAMRPSSRDAADPFTAALHRQFSNKGSITFRSYSGKAYRMDSDLEITFFPDGKAHVFLCGFTLEGYTGSYQIEPDGRIVAEFKRFSDQPMAMLLEQDDRSLLLNPADHHTRYVMGG